jgi:predicted AlkP superfamily phosphohydrolase/phosphomutase
MSATTPVVAISIDAADVSLIERLLEQGRLPTLQRLGEQGRFGRIESDAVNFASAVWPTFYSSQRTEHHGWYYGKMWRPERMRLEYAHDHWLPQNPFWEELDQERFRVALFDVPYALRTPEALNGTYISGWQTHDAFGVFSYPAGHVKELRSRFGRPAMKPERFGAQTAETLLRLRREMLNTFEQTADICRWMLESEAWDLFLAVLGGVHRGTHYLWDTSQIDTSGLDADTLRTLEGARGELYVAADRAVGRILEVAPAGARVLVFALHGMEANSGWVDRLPQLVKHVHGGRDEAPHEGFLYRWKQRIPWRLVRQVTTRLPTSVNHKLVPLWSARMLDWSKTRFFALPVDINGYVRVNLRGREPMGIVEPGEEYQAVLDEIEAAFRGFRTIDTGEPIVRNVVRVDDAVDTDAPRRDLLPDLVIHWSRTSSQQFSGVVSERYGELRWEKGAPIPSGRSGNHLPDGWLVASGPGIDPGPALPACDSLDIAPTILEWLGAQQLSSFQGRPVRFRQVSERDA